MNANKRTKSIAMEMLWPALRIIIGVYVGLCLFLFLFQSRYVYYPSRKTGSTPGSIGLKFDDLRIKTKDGETITGWFVPAGNGGQETNVVRTVLVCHGNAGDIGGRVDNVKTFHDMGYNVLMFDYRGYGGSTGKPSEQGTYNDVLACWDYLKTEKNVSAQDVILYGQSLGGAVATWLAEQIKPGALILESTLTSVPAIAVKMFPYLPVRLLCTFKYDSLSRIENIHCPVLIAHSSDDEMIPFAHGQKLLKAANEPKQFVEMKGDHNSCSIDYDPSYRRIAGEFLEKYKKSNE